jgi:hypothetical protein
MEVLSIFQDAKISWTLSDAWNPTAKNIKPDLCLRLHCSVRPGKPLKEIAGQIKIQAEKRNWKFSRIENTEDYNLDFFLNNLFKISKLIKKKRNRKRLRKSSYALSISFWIFGAASMHKFKPF